jgi:hypothetical protein
MKTFIIKTSHTIEIDDFEYGLTKYINSYDIKEEIEAENPIQAIEKYFKDVLYYDFNIENAYIYHHEDENEDTNILSYDVLVDEENVQATENEKDLWSKFKKTLYNNNINLKIYELNPVTI